MKKLLLLLCISMGLMVGVAKANATLTLYDGYPPAHDNYDTFTFYVSDDGYLHYSLIDNGPGGTDYESEFGVSFVDPITHENNYVFVILPGGGDIVGSVYIGTVNTTLNTLMHGAGYYTGPNYYNPEAWDVDVAF